MEDVQVRRQLEAHRAWEVLDDMALAVIDQTYAAVVELLGLDAPPEGGAPVRASQLVDPPDDDPSAADSPATPVLVVVEASARHCCVRLVDVDASEAAAAAAAAGGDRRFGYKGIERNWMYIFPRQPIHPALAANRRARARASQGTVHLARADGGGQAADMSRNRAGDVVVRPDVAEKGLLGVLEAMASHLDAAIRLEDGVIAAARVGGCKRLLRAPADVIKVRMLLGHMRRQVDVDAFMRRGIILRCKHGAAVRLFGRRRQAAEMDVDQVDEEDVLSKRLRGLQVDEPSTTEDACISTLA